jgi:hypothetical protein
MNALTIALVTLAAYIIAFARHKSKYPMQEEESGETV